MPYFLRKCLFMDLMIILTSKRFKSYLNKRTNCILSKSVIWKVSITDWRSTGISLQCNIITYIGVDIDNVLSWNLQTDSISQNFFFIISRLSRLKPVLQSQMLMYIYTSIIQPKIDYAISIWGYTTAHNINKVQRLLNRAARILTGNFDYVNTRGIDLVNNLGLMNVTQRRDYFMLIMMFKSIHGLVPDYICDEITMQRDITVRTTSSTVNNNVHVPHIILECCKMHSPIEVRFYGMRFPKI